MLQREGIEDRSPLIIKRLCFVLQLFEPGLQIRVMQAFWLGLRLGQAGGQSGSVSRKEAGRWWGSLL